MPSVPGVSFCVWCGCQAGDIVIMPARWSHLVLNLRTSVGVAKEFGSVTFSESS